MQSDHERRGALSGAEPGGMELGDRNIARR
jgi:hypothetical protein